MAPSQMGDHIAYRYEVTSVLGRGSFGQVWGAPGSGAAQLRDCPPPSLPTPRPAVLPSVPLPPLFHPQVLRAVDHCTKREVALKIIRNKKRCVCLCALPAPAAAARTSLTAARRRRFQKQAAVEAAILALLREQVGVGRGGTGRVWGRRGATRQAGGRAAGSSIPTGRVAPPTCLPALPPSHVCLLQDPDDTVNIVRTYDSFIFRCGAVRGPAWLLAAGGPCPAQLQARSLSTPPPCVRRTHAQGPPVHHL